MFINEFCLHFIIIICPQNTKRGKKADHSSAPFFWLILYLYSALFHFLTRGSEKLLRQPKLPADPINKITPSHTNIRSLCQNKGAEWYQLLCLGFVFKSPRKGKERKVKERKRKERKAKTDRRGEERSNKDDKLFDTIENSKPLQIPHTHWQRVQVCWSLYTTFPSLKLQKKQRIKSVSV